MGRLRPAALFPFSRECPVAGLAAPVIREWDLRPKLVHRSLSGNQPAVSGRQERQSAPLGRVSRAPAGEWGHLQIQTDMGLTGPRVCDPGQAT